MDVQSKPSTKASLTFLVTINMGYPEPGNPRRFETVSSNASQTPECVYVPECFRVGPLQPIKAGSCRCFRPFKCIFNSFASTGLKPVYTI